MATSQQIGERIRARRILLGYLPGDIARMLDISRSTYSKYESGYITISSTTLYQISKILAKPIAWFYGDGAEDSKADKDEELLNYYHRVRPEFREAALVAVRSLVDVTEDART